MRVRLLLATVVVAAACGGSESPLATTPTGATNKTVDVYTIGAVFSGDSIAVAVGDTVRWNFAKSPADGLGHNVRFNPRLAGSPADIGTQALPLTSGTVSRVFTTAGTFQYVCDLHGGMTGEVVVQ